MLWVLIRSASICGYSLEVPHRGASNEYPQHMFSWTRGASNEYPQHMFSWTNIFFLFVHENIEALLMSTHNICFRGQIRKLLT